MNTTWLNFTGFPQQNVLNQNFKDTTIKSAEEQKQTYYRISNYCRDWFTPVFSDDVVPQEAPAASVEVVSVELKETVKEGEQPSKTTDSKFLTVPPIKIEESTLLNALLIGLGAALVVKIVS